MINKIRNKFSKISFRNKNLLDSYSSIIAMFSSFITLLSFCIPPSGGIFWRIGSSLIFLSLLGFIFVYNWYKANQTDHADLKINETNVRVYVGDLFTQTGLKIIGVNNYIDLVADDRLVSSSTLHGQFLLKFSNEINEVKTAITE